MTGGDRPVRKEDPSPTGRSTTTLRASLAPSTTALPQAHLSGAETTPGPISRRESGGSHVPGSGGAGSMKPITASGPTTSAGSTGPEGSEPLGGAVGYGGSGQLTEQEQAIEDGDGHLGFGSAS